MLFSESVFATQGPLGLGALFDVQDPRSLKVKCFSDDIT